MQSSVLSRNSLYVAAALVLAGSGALWIQRERALSRQERRNGQYAASLLFRAFHTDNFSTYSARSTTMALYGGQKMDTVALLTRTPRYMSIVYEKGAHQGLKSGFSQHWFWRQQSSAPMQAYASVQRDANEMAARRFVALMENYQVTVTGEETVSGRAAEVVEIKPWHAIDGARGPVKRLWIDRQSGLTLREDAFNYQMRRVMRSTLTDVNFSPKITPATFAPPHKVREQARRQPWMVEEMGDDTASVAAKAGIHPPRPGSVPPGFQLDGVGMHRCPSSGTTAALSRYTDGLNTLTIFAMASMPGAPKAPQSGAPTKGAPTKGAPTKGAPASDDQACEFGSGTLVTRQVPGGYLLAVADLPQQTLERVLDSTRLEVANVKPTQSGTSKPATASGKALLPVSVLQGSRTR